MSINILIQLLTFLLGLLDKLNKKVMDSYIIGNVATLHFFLSALGLFQNITEGVDKWLVVEPFALWSCDRVALSFSHLPFSIFFELLN